MQLPKRKVMRPFAETKTGNEKLDSLLNEAVAQGRSQQVATPGTSDREQEVQILLMQLQPQLKQQRLRPQLSMLLQVVQERQTQAIQGTVFQAMVSHFSGT